MYISFSHLPSLKGQVPNLHLLQLIYNMYITYNICVTLAFFTLPSLVMKIHVGPEKLVWSILDATAEYTFNFHFLLLICPSSVTQTSLCITYTVSRCVYYLNSEANLLIQE